jgi:hypothetical protein
VTLQYVDPNTIHNPATGTAIPAAWGDQVRDNLESHEDPPVCSISDSAVTVNSATLVVLGATGTENFDNDAMHSNVTNRSRITIQTAGRYLFLGNAFTDSFTGTLHAFVRISFRIDGTTAVGGTQLKNSTATEAVRLTAARSLVLTAGQYVEMTTQHSLSGSVQVTLDEFLGIRLTR